MFVGGMPRIEVHMTDRDVIARVARMWGVKVVSLRPQKAHHKPTYRATINGGRAADWMTRLRPLMSTRRQSQIDRAIEFASPSGSARGRLLHPHEIEEIVKAVRSRNERVPAIAARYGIRRESVYRLARRHPKSVLGIGEPNAL